jgi:Rieske Fe-S protein
MAHAPSRRRVVRSVSRSSSISKVGVSLWSATSKAPSIPALDKNINADVCIVGAGIAGMTTAYLLAREGKSVVILDKSQIGSGETAHTTAHFIGRNPKDDPNVYIVTGDSGAGITHGTIAGILLRDLIVGRDNPWVTLYDPARKTLPAAATFVPQNPKVADEYAHWLTPGEVSTVEEIKPGMGAVIRRGSSKFAVARDDKGILHVRSAVCSHLGCTVSWNSTEHTWDCPCHGSRFTPDGKLLNGPALGRLVKTPLTSPNKLRRRKQQVGSRRHRF